MALCRWESDNLLVDRSSDWWWRGPEGGREIQFKRCYLMVQEPEALLKEQFQKFNIQFYIPSHISGGAAQPHSPCWIWSLFIMPVLQPTTGLNCFSLFFRIGRFLFISHQAFPPLIHFLNSADKFLFLKSKHLTRTRCKFSKSTKDWQSTSDESSLKCRVRHFFSLCAINKHFCPENAKIGHSADIYFHYNKVWALWVNPTYTILLL